MQAQSYLGLPLLQVITPTRAETYDGPGGIDIPMPLSEDQARLALALRDFGEDATWLMWAWTPRRFSRPQGVCVLEMLELDAKDFYATLADAMVSCALRGQLKRGRGFKDDAQMRLHEEIAAELECVRQHAFA